MITRLSYLTVAFAVISISGHAAVRSGTSYAVVAESFDPAGEAAASASYASVSDLGGVVDSSTSTVAVEFARHGFMGQITEVTGLSITGSPSVNEDATLPLVAKQVLDDGTLASLASTSVSWSVASGPVVGVSAAGVVTPGAVYEDTLAAVSGLAGGFSASFSFTVVNSLADNYGSYAGDGLPDSWQVQYFGVGNVNAGPAMDPDGDGYDNAFEYAAGLNPTSTASRFTINLLPVSGLSNQRQIVFSPLSPGSTYAIQSSPDLVHWSTLTGTVSDLGNQRTVTDASAGSRKFYRVNVSKP